MALNYEQIIKEVKNQLESNSTLAGYVDEVRIISPDDFDEEGNLRVDKFKDYAIILSAGDPAITERRRIGGKRDKEFRVNITCLFKSGRKKRVRLFTGKGGKGIYEFIEDVRNALRNNTLGGLVDNSAGEDVGDVPAEENFGVAKFINFTWTCEKRE